MSEPAPRETPTEGPSAAPDLDELRVVNERLLLASLREQELAAEARRLAEALEHRALHDALTDLPNRALFLDRLGQAVLAAGRERTTFAVLFLDLDHFKAVNDRLGHHAGDLLLRQVAARLQGALRDSDTVARLYGDEFAALLPRDDAAGAAVVARQILRALAPPFALHGQPHQVRASIGIALYPAHGTTADALMRAADGAMYLAKRGDSGYAMAGFGRDRRDSASPEWVGRPAGPGASPDAPLTFASPAARLLGEGEAAFLGRDARATLGTPGAAAGPAPLDDGRVAGTVVAFHDSADSAARRRAAGEHAAHLAQLEAALAFRARFLAITAHELGTPLTALTGHAQALLRRARLQGDAELLAALAAIDRQADRMARLLADLVGVARVEGGLAVDLRAVHLPTLVAETVAAVALATPDFALRLEVQAGDAWVRGDRRRLQQVLTTLLTNAVRYSPRRREAEISLRRDGDRAVVAVTDYGIGIPVAQQALVFEPYFRAANVARDADAGQGQGLFISKAIVDRHGGILDLVSAEGLGSTFSLSLPTLATGRR
ncbi:MAG TPA: diguanylate cyclase [Thermomicrobiales bacterium]|nr:diguanylate cyclase [Thermomicrobiales bacterium]